MLDASRGESIENGPAIFAHESERTPAEQSAETAARPTTELHINYANETQEFNHAYLAANDAQLNVQALKMPELINTWENQMQRAEEATAEGQEIDSPEAVGQIQEQLNKSQIDGHFVKMFAEIMRTFGGQIGMLVGDGKGMDRWNIGHKAKLEGPTFVIGASQEQRLVALLQNPPQGSLSEAKGSFRFRPRFDFLHVDGTDPEEQENGSGSGDTEESKKKKKLGFTVYFEAELPDGSKVGSRAVTFLLGKERSVH